MSIKWWLDHTGLGQNTTFMVSTGIIAVLGWALFAASIDRSTFHPYWVDKGQKIAIVFNTVCMFLIMKNLIVIKGKIPNFVGNISLIIKEVLSLGYFILLLSIILCSEEIIDEAKGQYIEYPLLFIIYFFYLSFTLDLQPIQESPFKEKE